MAGVAFLAAGCQERPATQIFIGLATDMDAPVPLQQISMKLERAVGTGNDFVPVDGGNLSSTWPIKGLPNNQYELPSSVIAYSEPGGEPKLRITVFAENAPLGQFVRRQAILRMVKEKTLFVRFGLTTRCVFNADCMPDRTCIEGRCRAPEIEATELPVYDPARKQETTFECNSGTSFLNTTSGEVLVPPAATCPRADQVCVEGTCYNRAVFGTATLGMPQMVEIDTQVTDASGAAVSEVEVRLEDGPLSLVRRLRAPDLLATAMPPPSNAQLMGAGRYLLQTRTDPLTTELRMTVTSPGRAPQVVSVPVKPGVSRYLVPVVMFPLVEQTVPAGATAAARSVSLRVGGRMATVDIGASARPVRVRYGLIDNRFAPGLPFPPDGQGLLQSVSPLYLENVGEAAFPAGTQVTLGTASTAAVVGAEGGATGYLLDMQGRWHRETGAVLETRPELLRTLSGGFWTVANHTPRPACVRGRIVRPDRSACPGARVRLWGPEGVSSFDSTGADGGFCAGAAQGDAAILAVGGSTRTIYVPPTTRAGVQCAQADTCTDIGEVAVDAATDCDRAPLDSAGAVAPGGACKKTNECSGLAGCYRDFCVSEGFGRVSMVWTVRADFDLHVKLPDGRVLSESTRELKDVGRLDVEQCAQMCTGDSHLENVVLAGKAPGGRYEAFVVNYGGGAAGMAQIEVYVEGRRRVSEMVVVPAGAGAMSPAVSFMLP